MSGRVSHFEIPADDVKRAQAFYAEAFGWNVVPMPEMGYTTVGTTPSDEQGRPTEVGGINGGMMQRQEPITGPVITIDVEDIDAALAKVTAQGGATVVGKQAAGDMGFTAYFTDSEGNTLGLWQSAT
ncbi:MAG: VOC family protein [Propionibacteriales bacterium]|nr:VOC family protein [Propionibacteriales bacterium]